MKYLKDCFLSVRPVAWVMMLALTVVAGTTTWTTSGSAAGITVIAACLVGCVVAVVVAFTLRRNRSLYK